jgi:curli biogenesis system outer membrane secretion channel CsgG
MTNNLRVYLIIISIFLLWGTTDGCTPSTHKVNGKPESVVKESIEKDNSINPPRARKLVAVAGFENKSTYSADKLWETAAQLLAAHLVKKEYFRVVEWQKMKQLFDWDTLSTANIVATPDNRQRARDILLCELFVGGVVSYFDVSQTAKVSALSKSKIINTTVRVDLWLQDAQTGEYIAAASGEGQTQQEYKGSSLGGKIGAWDPKSADFSLNTAIGTALDKLILQYDLKNRGKRNEN